MRGLTYQKIQCIIVFLLLIPNAGFSQNCGLPALLNKLELMNGMQNNVEGVINKSEEVNQNRTKIKEFRHDKEIRVPVIFHIVLNEVDLLALTEEKELREIIELQISYINRDFSGKNADSVLIPSEFKHLFGKAKIKFSLAHTSPFGEFTPGYETYNTNIIGYTDNNYIGSGLAFSNAKYKASGGADAWDPTTYLNVWVIHSLTNTSGVTIPPSFISEFQFPLQEIGIILDYKYLSEIYQGRTLVHELGHYFGLKHLWGDSRHCPKSEFDDDGIIDTPPQEGPNYGCPEYPKYDKCTKKGGGTMFMNYMDYSNESCKTMFTHGQVDVMRSNLMPFEESFSLTQNPAVFERPKLKGKNEYRVYPNPASNILIIVFKINSVNLKRIVMYDNLGRIVKEKKIHTQKGFYFLDINDLVQSIYILCLEFPQETYKERIAVY